MYRITYDFEATPHRSTASEDAEHIGSVRVTLKKTELGKLFPEKFDLVFQEDDGKGASNGVLCHALRQAAWEMVEDLPKTLQFEHNEIMDVASKDGHEDYGLWVKLTLVEVYSGN